MLVASLFMESIWEEKVADQTLMFQNHFKLTPSPLTSSLTLLMSVPPTLDTEQVYSPASLSARLLISSADLPVLLMILPPSPRRNTLPFFSQRISGAGTPVNVHTSSKRIPAVLVSGAGRSTMVGRAVEEKGKQTVIVQAAACEREILQLSHLLQNTSGTGRLWLSSMLPLLASQT